MSNIPRPFIILGVILFGFITVIPQCMPKGSGTAHGQVVSLDGSPLSGVEIILKMRDSEQTVTAITDSKGCYQFKNRFDGYFTLTARLRGFVQEKVDSSIFEGDMKAIDFGLEVGRISDWPTTEISGIVRRGRKGVKFATVELISVFNHRLSERVTADNRGMFKFNVASPGRYLLYALDERGVAVTPLSIPGSTRDRHFTINLPLSNW